MTKDIAVVEKQPENWIHYSSSPTQILMRTTTTQANVHDKDSFMMKPKGLWITPEYANHNWFDWCTSEEFRCGDLNFMHDVKVRPDAILLRLESAEDIDAFTKEYGFNTLVELGLSQFSKRTDGIRWGDVAKKYQGILIPNYVWERRLMSGADWYYPWDCASGCIWNASAVESITVRPGESAGYVSRVFDFQKTMESLKANLKKEDTDV